MRICKYYGKVFFVFVGLKFKEIINWLTEDNWLAIKMFLGIFLAIWLIILIGFISVEYFNFDKFNKDSTLDDILRYFLNGLTILFYLMLAGLLFFSFYACYFLIKIFFNWVNKNWQEAKSLVKKKI